MVSRDEIKPQVIKCIQAVTSEPALAENENSDLSRDLGMSPKVKECMGVSYTKIAKSYTTGNEVTQSDAGGCKTVKDSIDLVHKRANGDNK
jgi:hypothetical protein